MNKVKSYTFGLSKDNINAIYRQIVQSLALSIVFWLSVGLSNDFPAIHEKLSTSYLASTGAFFGVFVPCWLLMLILMFVGTQGALGRYKLVYCAKSTALYAFIVAMFQRSGIEYGYSNINLVFAGSGANQISYIVGMFIGTILAIYFVLLIGRLIIGGFTSGFGVKINHDTDPETEDIELVWNMDNR